MELPSISELQKTEYLTNAIMNNTGLVFFQDKYYLNIYLAI